MNRTTTSRLAGLAGALGLLCIQTAAQAPDPVASRVDPYVAKPRVVVLTDIANEPDDQMSMVRFLVYSNQLRRRGARRHHVDLDAEQVRPDVIHHADRRVRDRCSPTCCSTRPDSRPPLRCGPSSCRGRPATAWQAVGPDKLSAGAELIVRAADRDDPRPLWVLAWGGANTLAQALSPCARHATAATQLEALVSKLRVYSISDQDDAGPWIRREFPALHYVAMPSTPDGEQYYLATWTGISGDRFYKNAPGADFTTFSDEWVNAQHSQQGAARQALPIPVLHPRGRHAVVPRPDRQRPRERDEPDLRRLGRALRLAAVLRRDAAVLDAGRRLVSRPRQLARHRDRRRRQRVHVRPGHDLAMATRVPARLRGAHGLDDQGRAPRRITIPLVVVNGRADQAPVLIDAVVGTPVVLDAAAPRDPDGHALSYSWFFYPEAGTGIPGQPVVAPGLGRAAGAAVRGRAASRRPRPADLANRRLASSSSTRPARRRRSYRRVGRHRARDPGRGGRRDARVDLVSPHHLAHQASVEAVAAFFPSPRPRKRFALPKQTFSMSGPTSSSRPAVRRSPCRARGCCRARAGNTRAADTT